MSMLNCRDYGFECNDPVMYCLCLCPYCGENDKNCKCSQKLASKETASSGRKTPSNNPRDKITNPSKEYHIGESWWRLEKWQIGRCNFA